MNDANDERSSSGLSESQREALKEDIAAIVTKAIDTPSYKDLRETIGIMQVHQRKVRQETEGIMRLLGRTRRSIHRRNAMAPALGIGLASGLTSGLLAIAFMAPILTKPDSKAESPAAMSAPVEHGIVDYTEAELPEFGGKVGLVFVGGEVLAAFKEENRGVVVVNPLTEQP